MDYLIELDNIENATFTGNTVTAAEGVAPKITLNHIGNAEINTDIKVENIGD